MGPTITPTINTAGGHIDPAPDGHDVKKWATNSDLIKLAKLVKIIPIDASPAIAGGKSVV